MSAAVDVLKLLRYHARISTSTWGPDNQDADALAAVEELIGAVEPAASDDGMDQKEIDRLRAALARVKGA